MNRKIFFFICWVLSVCAGIIVAECAPDEFDYVIGFITGTFAFMLRLLADKK
jgi:hypothetical protein